LTAFTSIALATHFVTLLLDRGVPLAAVQDAASRASSDTTRRYRPLANRLA
jgi:hypothetical protein